MVKPKKSPLGFGVVKRIKLGGKWTTVIGSDRIISREESIKEARELQKKYHRNRNGNGE